MAIAASKIRELGTAQGEALGRLVRADPSKEIQWKEDYEFVTPSGNTILKTKTNKAKASDLLGWFNDRVDKAAIKLTTKAIDELIYVLHKPSFPFKSWMAEYIDASDNLHKDGM